MNARSGYYDQLSFEEHVKLEFHDDYRRMKAEYLRQFLPKNGIFMDTGCGSGFDLKHMVNDTSSFVGIDHSMNMLSQTREWTRKTGKRLMLVQADAGSLPFKDSVFDMVHSHELSVFNNPGVPEQIRVLDEQRRVCKQKGYVVLVLPTKYYDGSGFLPSDEERMKYLICKAGIKFVKPVYYLGRISWWSAYGILILLNRFLPDGVAKRFIKTPEEYMCGRNFFLLGLGKKN